MTRPELADARIPRHVAIIMDGNGRWATARGQGRGAGHRAGIQSVREVIRTARDYGVEVLGALPLDISIREQADSGKPTVVSDPDGRIAAIYRQIARRVAVRIAERQQDHSAAFPKIVVQNT